MDFISAAWAASGGCWGSPSRVPLTHTSANPTMNQQKKPRQGSGAREIREIRTIRAVKPLQTLKGSAYSAHHLRRLASLNPLPQIAAEAEGCTDSKQRKGAWGLNYCTFAAPRTTGVVSSFERFIGCSRGAVIRNSE